MSGHVVVIGLARSGLALARTLHREGHTVLVADSDDTPALRERAAFLPDGVDVRLGGYADDVARGAVMICPSPGVPWDAPVLETSRRLGVPVRSEIDLVFERCRGRVVGITGTNGKTTTTSLIAAVLSRGGRRVHLGGNIGVPMLDRLDGVDADDWVVLELSSYQLETVAAPRCSVACVLNVTPDHLDRHGSFDAYAAIKQRLVVNAADGVVLGYDDPVTRAMAAAAAAPVRFFGRSLRGDGATVRAGDVVTVEAGDATQILALDEIQLRGTHNVLNVLAAVAVSRLAGVAPGDIAAGVRGFRAVPHRLETILARDGVTWVNDSKATNPESAVMGLEAFAGMPIVWIGGGRRSDASLDALADAVVRLARLVVLNGESASAVERALTARGYAAVSVVPSLADAVAAVRDVVRPGDVVLLSPGFKSFDQFRDFEHRGEVFATLARQTPVAGRTHN